MLVYRGKYTLDDPSASTFLPLARMKVVVERKDDTGQAGARPGAAAATHHDRGFAAAHLSITTNRLLMAKGWSRPPMPASIWGDFRQRRIRRKGGRSCRWRKQPRTLWDYGNGHSADVLAA